MIMTLVNVRTEEIIQVPFQSPFFTLSHINFANEILFLSTEYIINSLNVFNMRGSGWRLYTVNKYELKITKGVSMRGGSCVPKPKELKNRKGLICLQAPGELCFLYSVIACLHYQEVPIKSRGRWRFYKKFLPLYPSQDIEFPVDPNKVEPFEDSHRINIHILTHDRSQVYPLRVSTKRYDKTVHLLYVGDKNRGHYISIFDLNFFLGKSGEKKRHYCLYCLNKFPTKTLKNKHQDDCKNFGLMVMKFPERTQPDKPPVVEFKDYQKTLYMPFAAYADFECCLPNLDEKEREELSTISTTYVKKLEPISYGLLLIGPHGFHRYFDYCGENVAEHFLKTALQMADYCLEYMQTSDQGIPELMSFKNNSLMKQPSVCDKYPKCRHHHPVLNYYIGVACSFCNTLVSIA